MQNFERNAVDILEHFESDDDFEQNIDYEALDEIENSQRPTNTVSRSYCCYISIPFINAFSLIFYLDVTFEMFPYLRIKCNFFSI